MPSSKTEVIMKSMNMYIWALGTLNQLLIRGTYTQINFSKKKWSSQWQKFIFYRSIFVFILAFNGTGLYGNVALSFVYSELTHDTPVFKSYCWGKWIWWTPILGGRSIFTSPIYLRKYLTNWAENQPEGMTWWIVLLTSNTKIIEKIAVFPIFTVYPQL